MTYKLFMMLLLSIVVLSVNSLTSEQINYIRDYAINGTDLPIDLSSVNDEYVYFSFNSTLHYELSSTNKNTSIFYMETDVPMIKEDSVSFFFSQEEWDQLGIEEVKNETWKETKIVYRVENKDTRHYYYKIERTDEKYKTLLLRVATNNVKKGELTVINEDKIPSKGQSIGRNIHISKLIDLFLLIINLW